MGASNPFSGLSNTAISNTSNPFLNGQAAKSIAAFKGQSNPFAGASSTNPFTGNTSSNSPYAGLDGLGSTTSSNGNPFADIAKTTVINQPVSDTSNSNPFAALASDNNKPTVDLHALTDGTKATTPPSVNSTGGGILNGLWHGIQNVYNHGVGALEGAMAGSGGADGAVGLPGFGEGFIKGLINPNQAESQYQQMKATGEQHMNPIAKVATNFALDTASDPLTYVPLGKVAEIAHVPQALDTAKNMATAALRATHTGAKALDYAKALRESATSILPGTRDYFKQAYANFLNHTATDNAEATNAIKQAFQGKNPAAREAFQQEFEKSAEGQPLSAANEQTRQLLAPILAQTRQHALDTNILTHTMNPDEMKVGQYFPHVLADKLADTKGATSTIGNRIKTTIDANKARNIPGTIAEINANPELPNFEADPAKALGYHLYQFNNAKNSHALINEVMAHGYDPTGLDGVYAGDIHPETNSPLVEYSHGGKTVLLPKAEAQTLQNLTSNQRGPWTKLWQGATNFGNRSMFLSNPTIHLLNNLGWQTLSHAPNIFSKIPKYISSAFKDVPDHPMMLRAMRAGALHHSFETGQLGSGTAKDFANRLAKSLDQTGNPILKAFNKYYYNLTPNAERAYRTAAFEHALDQGMNDQQAADYVHQLYGGNNAGMVNNVDKAMGSVLPFWNWTKTAISSNAKNALENPFPYSALYHAMNAVNEQNSGNDMLQNVNPLAMSLGTTNAQGKPESLEPYLPPMEIAKLVRDTAQQGPINGPATFLFNKASAPAKFLGQILTGEQNPTAAVPQKYNLLPAPYSPVNAPENQRGIYWGDTGPQVNPYLAQAAQDFPNILSNIAELSGKSPLAQTLINPLVGTGGTIVTSNPQSAAKEQAYAQRQQQTELRSYLKKLAQGQ